MHVINFRCGNVCSLAYFDCVSILFVGMGGVIVGHHGRVHRSAPGRPPAEDALPPAPRVELGHVPTINVL